MLLCYDEDLALWNIKLLQSSAIEFALCDFHGSCVEHDPRGKIAAPAAPSPKIGDCDDLATASEFRVRTNH